MSGKSRRCGLNPFSEVISSCVDPFFLAEDDGWISPMKSNPHCWKGLSIDIGFKARGNTFIFPSNMWHLWREVTFL